MAQCGQSNRSADGKCSRCGLFSALSPANKSRIDGARLYRSWCCACEKTRKDEWRAKNKLHHNEKCKRWAASNPEKRAATSRKYRANTPIEIERERRRMWRSANPERSRAQVNARRRALRQATPKSLSEFDMLHIGEIYHLAQLRRLTVDHIVPITHPLVCGLHAPWNMQLMPASDNAKKSNASPEIRAMRKLPK